MDLDDLVDRAKDLAEDHEDELKETAEDLKDIATGDGSVTDKLEAAAKAAKEDLT
jgi:chorismate-pyruvate lyase